LKIQKCPTCGLTLKFHSQICDQCARVTRERLSKIPVLYVEASAYLEPGRGGSGSSGSERTIGVNLAALEFRQSFATLAILEDWERTVRVKSLGQVELDGQEREGEIEVDENGLIVTMLRSPFSNERPVVRRGSIEERVKGVCEFLLAHMRWLTSYEAAGDFAADVAKIHAQGMAATRQIEEKASRIRCPADIEMWVDGIMKSEICGHSLYLKEDIFADIECKGCRALWTTAGLLRKAMKTPGQVIWMDSVAIARLLEIRTRDVTDLVKAHEVKKRGKRGNELYDLIEINSLRAKMEEK
jgi:hypothetical protein